MCRRSRSCRSGSLRDGHDERAAAVGLEGAVVGHAAGAIERQGRRLVGENRASRLVDNVSPPLPIRPHPWMVLFTLVSVSPLEPCSMTFAVVLDIVTVPPPVKLVLPVSWRNVSVPVDARERVPLLVIVPVMPVTVPFSTVAVLPELTVTPLSVLPPASMTPPLLVVSVPPVIVLPLRLATEPLPVERIVPLALVTATSSLS